MNQTTSLGKIHIGCSPSKILCILVIQKGPKMEAKSVEATFVSSTLTLFSGEDMLWPCSGQRT